MYDLTVIGAGWAGFNACLKARELGKKVCLIEQSEIGGTCLNSGCIPTKSLIYSARFFSQAKKAQQIGLVFSDVGFDLGKACERKNKLISGLRNGMQSQLNGIDYINADARFINAHEILAGKTTVKTGHCLIASGSVPAELGFLAFDGKRIISSTDALSLKKAPGSLLIVGAGAIGSEFACIFAQLGTQVTLAEKMPQVLPGMDNEVARKIETSLKKKGIRVITSCDVQTLGLDDFELILVAVGRKPRIEGLGLDTAGVKTEKGRIQVDGYLRTSADTVYAAGDCTGTLMLAHFASYQGVLAVENMFAGGAPVLCSTDAVPVTVFTDPEAASVGLTQEQAQASGSDLLVKRIDFRSCGMAHIIDEPDGFIKIIAEKKSGKITGAHIVGPKATELIAIMAVSITSGNDISQLKETIFAHPSLSEAVGECARK